MTTVSLARDRDWWRWSAAVGLVRIPPAMATLTLAFAGRYVADSYAVGAALGACFALGEAVSAPWRGKVLDDCTARERTTRMTRALLVSAAVFLALACAVWLKLPLVVLFALTAACAVLPAGLPGGYRALLTGMLDPARLRAAFGWDAAVLEVEWFLAPLLLTLVLLTGQPALAMVVMAVCALGAAAITRRMGDVGSAPAEPAAPAGRGAWKSPAAWPTYLTSVLLGVAEGGLVAVLPALLVVLSAQAAMAGVFAAALSVGSFLGGVLLAVSASRLRGRAVDRADVALVLMGLLLFPAALVPTAPWLLIPLVAGGLFIAPVNALRSEALENALPLRLRSEGFSIQYGAHGLGVAAGSLLVATLVTTNPKLALAVVAGVPALVAAASLAVRLTPSVRRRVVPVASE
ncbi:hypothetical protein [Actinosynnema sp. NPDC020468]|uniref:hypothetical protein n=1 Tax=Actinosynnema sp. NPDC020468 TaxID=3154488 RepID=UPI0033DA366B